MTTLINQIKQSQLQSRKEKDQVSTLILTTLLGEASMIGKNDGNRETTDAEVVQVIKKFIKNIDETLLVLEKEQSSNVELIEKFSREKSILNEYLPKQMNKDELFIVIKDIVAEKNLIGPKSMGLLMKELKEKHSGQYDGSSASSIAKEVLK